MKEVNLGIPIEDTFELHKVLDLFFKSFQGVVSEVLVLLLKRNENFEPNVFDNINFTISDYYLKDRIEEFILGNKKGEIKKLKHIFETRIKETNDCFDMVINNSLYEDRKNSELTPSQNLLEIQSDYGKLLMLSLFSFRTGITTIEYFYNSLRKKFDESIAEIAQAFEYELNQTDKEPDPAPLDLSDTSVVQKIIYLNELGIIDFLRDKREFASSVNLMATVLSAITGEKSTTLQSSLNRLVSNDTDDKNHPYYTKKTVAKVRQTLIDKNIKPKTS